MKYEMKSKDDDWCHLCGIRDRCAEIWYPTNAEHDSPVKAGPPDDKRKYIRICWDCGNKIAKIASQSAH